MLCSTMLELSGGKIARQLYGCVVLEQTGSLNARSGSTATDCDVEVMSDHLAIADMRRDAVNPVSQHNMIGLSIKLSLAFARARNRRPSVSVCRHRSEIVFGVLIVILCPNYVTGLSLSLR